MRSGRGVTMGRCRNALETVVTVESPQPGILQLGFILKLRNFSSALGIIHWKVADLVTTGSTPIEHSPIRRIPSKCTIDTLLDSSQYEEVNLIRVCDDGPKMSAIRNLATKPVGTIVGRNDWYTIPCSSRPQCEQMPPY